MRTEGTERSGSSRPWIAWSALVFVFLLVLLPFQNGALVIDDGNFVDQASQILRNPADPYSFSIRVWKELSFFTYSANPPGQAYLLALPLRWFGSSELTLHLACLPLAWLAVWGMYKLSEEVSGSGLLGALLIVTTPAFVMSAKTVMADTPAAAFYLVSVFWLIRGIDTRSTSLLLASGAAGAAAFSFKYSGVTVIPLMLLYPVLRGRLDIRGFLPAFVVTAWVAISSWLSLQAYGQVHLLTAFAIGNVGKSAVEQSYQLVATLMQLGGCILIPPALIAWTLIASRALGRRTVMLLSVVCACITLAAIPMIAFMEPTYSNPNRVLGALMLSAGSTLFFYAIARGLRGLVDLRASWNANDEKQQHAARTLLLVAWFCGLSLMNFELVFSTPRYLVPALAPAILLILTTPKWSRPLVQSRSRWEMGVVVAATGALALSLAIVDSSVAGFTRYTMERASALGERNANVWFFQHWTARYYAEKQGYKYLGTHTNPKLVKKGDGIVHVSETVGHPVPEDVKSRLHVVYLEDHTAPLPIHVASLKFKAGYWTHGLGIMPFVIAPGPHATARFFQIRQ